MGVAQIVHVGRLRHLQHQRLLAVVADIGAAGCQLETIEIVPHIGLEVHIDGRSVILEAAHRHRVLTETQLPVLCRSVVKVQEVSVVEEIHRACLRLDALTEIITEILTEIAAEVQVEILAVDTVKVRSVTHRAAVGSHPLVRILHIGACLQFELVEHLVPGRLTRCRKRNTHRHCGGR